MNKYLALKDRGLKPSLGIVLVALKVCSKTRDLNNGMRIHKDVFENGDIENVIVSNTLVDMYCKCGNMRNAEEIFQKIQNKDVVSWTAIVMGYAQNGQGDTALQAFYQMRVKGHSPNHVTLIAAIKACSSIGDVTRLRSIHCLTCQLGYESNTFCACALVHMYAKLGFMQDAEMLFQSMMVQDVVAWTSMIQGYASNGQDMIALDYYERMQMLGTAVVDPKTFVFALKACVGLVESSGKDVSLQKGRSIHEAIVKSGLHTDMYVCSMLVDMYSKCGSMSEARSVFDYMTERDVVAWTAIILGYAVNGDGSLALQFYTRMQMEGCFPNHVTLVAAAKACSHLGIGKSIHLHASCFGYCSNAHVGSALIEMYSRCGSIVDSCKTFESMIYKNVVAWTAIIQGCVLLGEHKLAMSFYSRMRTTPVIPDAVAFVAALKACSLTGHLDSGKQVHADIEKHGLHRNKIVATLLVDFYGKCGSMADAESVFDLISGDSVAWGVLIGGYSRQGDIKSMVDAFGRMRSEGVLPNSTIFLCMLTACSHAGLVEEARQWFETMWKEYGIVPGVEHYTCMVDLFSRSNRLDEAVSMLKNMPYEPDQVAWTSILDSFHGERVEKPRILYG